MNIEAQFNIIVSSINEMKSEIKSIKEQMATKEELKALESKMATKEELKALESKMATKEELKALESKMATKEDIRSIKKDIAKINDGIEAILEDIKMLDDRTRPIVRVKQSN